MSVFESLRARNAVNHEGPYCVWMECYIENVNEEWGIYWPDGTKAQNKTFKTKGWATRTLNWLIDRNMK